MKPVDYSNEFCVKYKDGSVEYFKLSSFSQLLFSCNKNFSDVVSIKRLPMWEL